MSLPRTRLVLSVPILPPRVLGPNAAPADYLVADAELEGEEAGYELERFDVASGRIDDEVWDNRPTPDVWLASDGRRGRVRIRPPWGVAPASDDASEGTVTAIFRHREHKRELTAVAMFRVDPSGGRLALPSGELTSPQGVYNGPAAVEDTVIVNDDPLVRIGLRRAPKRAPAREVEVRWAFLHLDTWLDESAPGATSKAPRFEVGVGRTKLVSFIADQRFAQLQIDPRDARRRLAVGRHPLTVVWSVRRGLMSREHRAAVALVVCDDGAIRIEPA